MLQITKVTDIDKYADKLKEYDIPKEKSVIFEVLCNDKPCGSAICEINEESIAFYEINSDDGDIYDAIVRTALNTASLRGIDRAYFKIADKAMLKKLSIINENDDIPSIEQFFYCKKCTER